MSRLASVLLAIPEMNFVVTLNFVRAVTGEPLCYLVDCHRIDKCLFKYKVISCKQLTGMGRGVGGRLEL